MRTLSIGNIAALWYTLPLMNELYELVKANSLCAEGPSYADHFFLVCMQMLAMILDTNVHCDRSHKHEFHATGPASTTLSDKRHFSRALQGAGAGPVISDSLALP